MHIYTQVEQKKFQIASSIENQIDDNKTDIFLLQIQNKKSADGDE